MPEKPEDIFSLTGVLRRPCVLSLLAICAIALFLNLRGITYGLPSRERMEVSLGGKNTTEKMLPTIRSALRRNIAERSETFAKKPDNFVELSKLSPYFDQVRTNNPDEFFIFKNLSYMVKNRTPIPNSFDYGAFYYYQVGGALLIGKLLGLVDTNHNAEYYLLNPEKIAPFYIAGRALAAVLMTLTIMIVFFIGYRLGRLPVAVFASLFLCFLPMVNLAGKFIKTEPSLMFFTALVLLFSVPVLKRALWSDYLLSGIFIGLATAVKYPGILNCSYIVMFHLIRRYSEWKRQKPETRKVFIKDDWKLLAAGAISIAAFSIVGFALIVNLGTFLEEIGKIKAACSRPGNIIFNMFDAFLCYFQDGFWYTLGIPAVVIMTCAMIYYLFKPSKFWLGCMPGILLFMYLAGKAHRVSDAYFLPGLIPVCLISAVWLFGFKNKKLRITLALVTLIGTFSYCWAYNQLLVKRSIRVVASEWINNNIPAGSTICTLRYPVFYRTPPLNPQKYDLVSQFIQGNDIVKKADYYVQTSYQWEPMDFITRYKYGEDHTLRPEFKRIKEFERIPKAFFGLLPLKRDHRLNYYFENINPKIIIFKADRQDKNL